MPKPLKIELKAKAILSGSSVLVLRPIWALGLGGVAEALVFEQLLYKAGGINDEFDSHTARFSYTRLQRQFPFYTRRWIIEVISRLEKLGAIAVTRGSRVNVYSVIGKFDIKLTPPNCDAKMLIFPELACKIGLMETVVLQQIHIRTHDSSDWVIRSFKQWHANVFMFLGIATVKRLFSKLIEQKLILVKPYHGDEGLVNSYRVNYVQLASILGIPIPEVEKPKILTDGLTTIG